VVSVRVEFTRTGRDGSQPIKIDVNQAMREAQESTNSEVSAGGLRVGDSVGPLELSTIQGKALRIPDGELSTHLQFRRYAGCPFCNLHLRSFARRHDEVVAAGVREVVVFYSEAIKMLDLQGNLPFAVVADPDYRVYEEFGARRRASLLQRLNPRSWLAAVNTLIRVDKLHGMMGEGEDTMGLPSEFLISRDGRVLAVKYGTRVDDHWSVDKLLELVGQGGSEVK